MNRTYTPTEGRAIVRVRSPQPKVAHTVLAEVLASALEAMPQGAVVAMFATAGATIDHDDGGHEIRVISRSEVLAFAHEAPPPVADTTRPTLGVTGTAVTGHSVTRAHVDPDTPLTDDELGALEYHGCSSGTATPSIVRDAVVRAVRELRRLRRPVDQIIFCPKCGAQHIDEATETWPNPPHRSHLCLSCRHVFRVADVPTNGVAEIKTAGKDDSPPVRGVIIHRLASEARAADPGQQPHANGQRSSRRVCAKSTASSDGRAAEAGQIRNRLAELDASDAAVNAILAGEWPLCAVDTMTSLAREVRRRRYAGILSQRLAAAELKPGAWNKYAYEVWWLEYDHQHIGRCVEFPSLICLAGSPQEALIGVADQVAAAIADMARTGEAPPAPRSQTRVPPFPT